jgi:Spy/CpxP family protein refolding chaperone
MKRTWQVVGCGLLALMLLSGCAAKTTSSNGSALSPKATETAKQPNQADGQPPDVQNRKERQLVMLFQGLLQIDRKEGLSLTAKQAKDMLPIVQKSKDEGEVTGEAQQQVLALLTSEQKAFYEDLSTKFKSSMNGAAPKNREDLTPEQRDKMIEDFKAKRNNKPDSDTAGNNAPRNEDDPRAFGKGMGKSVEQQLIDLLQSRISS